MEEKGIKKITVKLAEETYGKLKEYADARGESPNSAAGSIILRFLSESRGDAHFSAESGEFHERIWRVEGYCNELRTRVDWLSLSVNRIDGNVNALLSIFGTPTARQWTEQWKTFLASLKERIAQKE